MEKIWNQLIVFLLLTSWLGSCTDDVTSPVKKRLEVSVSTEGPNTKNLITSNRLPNQSTIGVFVIEPGILMYNGMLYNNIPYTVTGSDESQIWSEDNDVFLNDTHGYGYAYYPYKSSVKRPTEIPLHAEERNDILYSDPGSTPVVHAKSPTAHFVLKHALCLIRIQLTKGTYTGSGQVDYVWAQSECFGEDGKVNLIDGTITLDNPGRIVSYEPGITSLSGTSQSVDLYAVPGTGPATLHIGCIVDNHRIGIDIPAFEAVAGNIYSFNIQINGDGGCSLSGTQIDCWGFDHLNRPVIQVGEHFVSLDGDLSNLAFNATVSGSSLQLQMTPLTTPYFYDCTVSGNASETRNFDSNSQVADYKVSNLQSDVTLTFKGSSSVSFDWEVLEGRWALSGRNLFAGVNPQDGRQWRILGPSPGSVHRIRCTFTGCSKITFYTLDFGEQGYDYLRIGALDSPCSADSYLHSLQGTTGVSKYFTYETDGGTHFVEFCLATNETYTQAAGEARVCISSFE